MKSITNGNHVSPSPKSPPITCIQLNGRPFVSSTGRNAPVFLTCVDCLKDFRANEYVAHTKCMSEAERYAAKGTFVGKPDKNKGAQKQEIWTECIEELASRPKLDKTLRDILQRIAAQSNVPRKKPKFVNFLKSSMRFNVQRAEHVWKVIEEGLEEFKKRAAPPPKPTAADKPADEVQTNGSESLPAADATTNGTTNGNDAASTKQIAEVFAYALQQPDTDKATRKILKKLQKCPNVPLNVQKPKRKAFTTFVQQQLALDADAIEQIWTIVSSAASVIKEESLVNGTNGVAATNGSAKKRKTANCDDDAPSKKTKSENGDVTQTVNGNDATAFDWQKNILHIFSKNSVDNALELATLQAKVIKRYAKHVGDEVDGATGAQYVKKVKKQLKKIDSLIIENDVVKLKA